MKMTSAGIYLQLGRQFEHFFGPTGETIYRGCQSPSNILDNYERCGGFETADHIVRPNLLHLYILVQHIQTHILVQPLYQGTFLKLVYYPTNDGK